MDFCFSNAYFCFGKENEYIFDNKTIKNNGTSSQTKPEKIVEYRLQVYCRFFKQ
jgi:hypothetical protein